MVPSRASDERNPAPSVSSSQPVATTLAPAAKASSQALVLTRDAGWIAGVSVMYAVLVVATVAALHPYFSQTWDVLTFIDAGNSALSPAWNALYVQSRAENFWPYAYPPLHALAVAPFVALAGLVPDYLLVRITPLLFDIALGILLYHIVGEKTHNRSYARLALLVWLLNPVTWYDTAVQGHFEAEWLFFIVLGYWLAETKRGWVLPTLSLAIAFLFKQNAILFAFPFWASLFFARAGTKPLQRVLPFVASLLVYVTIIVLVSFPFFLYSNDYWYMNVQYVADVPLQTQSWLVLLAGLLGNENVILQLSSGLTLLTAALVALFAARRGMGLWLTGTLLALVFFLLSKKVVGYYYVMLLPFAIVTLIPAQRFRLLAALVVATAVISLSPYLASWVHPEHWWAYALLGTLNSLLWFAVMVWLWRAHPLEAALAQDARLPAFLSISLLFTALVAALLQPLVNSQTSPIRAPIFPPEMTSQTLLLLFCFVLVVCLAVASAAVCTRDFARGRRISPGAAALVVLLAPLYFLTFTLTKESTTVLEQLLTIWR